VASVTSFELHGKKNSPLRSTKMKKISASKIYQANGLIFEWMVYI